MCGISGIVSSNKSFVSINRLKQMTDAIAHRGPDGEGHWLGKDGEVALGCRRLAIIDLSDAGKQPMNYMDRYTITFNGAIYNYLEIRESLSGMGYKFSSNTDTEVILASFDRYGEDCVKHFDGMFAFAIWDEKEKILFAARDRFGEKPFFYFTDGNQLIFASEMKALWSAGVPKEPNLKLLFNYLTIGYVDNPAIPDETFYNNILKLPAATTLRYSYRPGKVPLLETKVYWDLDIQQQDLNISDEEAVGKFQSLFSSSVKKRYRMDVMAGTSLSGGIDSSSVVAQSSLLNADTDSHKCFTAVFPGFIKDESRFAKQVAEHFHLHQYMTEPHEVSFLEDLDKVFYHQEEPFSSASTYAQFMVYSLASKQNTKVLLDGQGADETLAGYQHYYKWYWQELFSKRNLAKSKELQYAAELGVIEKFTWKNRAAALFPEFASVFLERQYLLNALKHEDLSTEFSKQHSQEAYYTTPEIFSLNGALYFNTRVHGLEELLRYADRNSMAHGCEIRLPFLQHELVEFIFSLPSHFKIRRGWSKWLLRKSMEHILPREITWRKEKIGFEPPQLKWMQHREFQSRVQSAKDKLVKQKILNPAVMKKAPVPSAAYESGNYDWRYLLAAYLF